MVTVYDKARKFMRENGNAEQWGEDYPSAELIKHDIDKMYLCSLQVWHSKDIDIAQFLMYKSEKCVKSLDEFRKVCIM